VTRTALYHHDDCRRHAMEPGHPEAPERLAAILERLRACGLAAAMETVDDAPEAATDDLVRVHGGVHLAGLEARLPTRGLTPLDGDTTLGPDTLLAARRAAGAATDAVDRILAGTLDRAFCAVRPPGHHAERDAAMGFCFVNSVAVAAARALEVGGLERVAILDFDVHHGNGTVSIFADDPRVLVASSFQHPFYPGRLTDVPGEHLLYTPLPAGTDGSGFRRAIERDWVPALERHAPQLVLVSAGFDAHRDDPLGGLRLDADDFAWVTRLIVEASRPSADGRLVSLLEGGYDLAALADCVEAHVGALVER
jgi:acetoin utilization deacetylase AcuC-like enzyme